MKPNSCCPNVEEKNLMKPTPKAKHTEPRPGTESCAAYMAALKDTDLADTNIQD